MATRVVVLAGYRRSAASSLLVWRWGTYEQGVELAGVVCVSEYSLAYLRRWLRALGPKQFKQKLFRELTGKNTTADPAREMVFQQLRQHGVPGSHLAQVCGELGVPFHVVKKINDAKAIRLIQDLEADTGVYSGAGILRKRLLETFPGGVLNSHAGPLPHIRGMNATEWSLYYGIQPEITLHEIDPGIDTGRILASRKIPVDSRDTLDLIRMRTHLTGIDLMTEILPQAADHPRRENPPGQGRQYFAMHAGIKNQVQSWVEAGLTPRFAAEDVSPEDLRPAPLRVAA